MAAERASSSPRLLSPQNASPTRSQTFASRIRTLSHTTRLWGNHESEDSFDGPRSACEISPHSNAATTSPPRRRRRGLFFRSRQALPPKHHPSSAAFRHDLVRGSSSSSKPTLALSGGRVMELAPIPMGGNCGFVAISWALLIAGRLPGNDTSGAWVRKSLAAHVSSQAAFYAARLVEWRVVEGGAEEAARSVREFVKKVGEEGLRGHWLGQMWGFLEIFAVARAFRLHVELYTFDVASQTVRMYHRQNEGKTKVALMFSGAAEGGHFDLLLPIARFSDLWKNKRKW